MPPPSRKSRFEFPVEIMRSSTNSSGSSVSEGCSPRFSGSSAVGVSSFAAASLGGSERLWGSAAPRGANCCSPVLVDSVARLWGAAAAGGASR